MKIGIDCRYLGLSGIGRYLENLLEYLDYDKYDYVLFGKEEQLKKYKKAKHIYTNESPFSKKGLLNKVFKVTKTFDWFYTPNFIIPFTVKCKVVSTLHDIIFLDMKEVNSGFIDYCVKKYLLKRGMKKSEAVFTVSNFSKQRIAHYFPKYENKIIVSYPGIESSFKEYKMVGEKEDYVIFVGNIKKHKGLHTLLDAFGLMKDSNVKLYIVGDAKKIRNSDSHIADKLDNPNVLFTGYLSDSELKEKIARAKFLVQSSEYEGFGLPPLEALYLGTRPIISDIEVFKEVYSDLPVVFFKLNDANDLKQKILSSDYFYKEIDKGYLDGKFNPQKCAKLIETKFI